MCLLLSLDISLPGLCKKRRRGIMTHVVFIAKLRHFLQYVFINRRSELSPYRFSQIPARRTVEASLQTIPQPSLPGCPLLHSLVSPFFLLFFHASEHRKREYVFNECSPSPVPGVLFTFTNSASSLALLFLSLCLPTYIS